MKFKAMIKHYYKLRDDPLKQTLEAIEKLNRKLDKINNKARRQPGEKKELLIELAKLTSEK